jgi:hypothetical protein
MMRASADSAVWRRLPLAFAALALNGSLTAAPAAAQEPAARTEIAGTWTISFSAGGNPGETQNTRLQQSEPPLKPEYRAVWQARQAAVREADARGEPLATSATLCLPQGMPSMMGGGGPFPMEILVSEGQITIIQEAYNQVRRIYLDRPQLSLDEIEPGFYGRSVGRWEGDTLVVDTIGIKKSVEFRNVPHSLDMRITERLRLDGPDTLVDEITLEDPEVMTEPWNTTFTFSRLPDYEIMEYICEDNREYADESGATRLRVE